MTATRLVLLTSVGTLVLFGCSAQEGGTPGTGTDGSSTGGAAPAGNGGSGSGSGGAHAGSGGLSAIGSGGTGNGAGAGGATVGTAGTGGGAVAGGPGGGAGSGATATGGIGTGAAGPATGSGGSTGGTGAGGGGSGAAGSTVGDVPLDASLLSKCNGTNPIRCTIPVPKDGDYNVTVELGGAAASNSRIQAELYRIAIPPVALAAGTYAKQTFSVNVRAEKHDGYSAPGMVLDLLIDGSSPALHGVGFAAAPTIPTIFVAGDSTVCDWDPALASILDPLERGWAQEFSQFLKPGIAVANYADSGEKSGGFYTKFFPQARDAMKSGDYLFIQFGHNDQKDQSSIDTYAANLTKYIADAKSKGATPILFTPVARKGATVADPGFAGLDQQVRDLAASQKVTLVDLTLLAIAYYKTVPDLSTFFAGGGTHFMETGATQISGVVAKDLKAGNLPLTALIK